MPVFQLARRALQPVFAAALALSAFAAPALAASECGGADLVSRLEKTNKAGYRKHLAELAKMPNHDGLLWKIEKAGVAPSHLFGTFHANEPRLMAVAERAAPVVKQSTSVLTELGDMSQSSKQLAMARLMLGAIKPENKSLSLVSGKRKRAKIVELGAERGLPETSLDEMPPWLLVTLFALPACQLEKTDRPGVDDRIVEFAREAKVEIDALEEVEEQIEVIKSIDRKLIASYLDLVAGRPAVIDDSFATLVDQYVKSQPAAALTALPLALKLDPGQAKMNADFTRKLLGDRNETMRRRSTPYLEKGGAFIAVGALHLPGADGLVALYRKDGWTVTKVW